MRSGRRSMIDFMMGLGMKGICKNFLWTQDGSVLMEYVVLLVFVGVILMVASHTLLFGYGAGEGLGPLGQQIQGFFQRTMGGLSLPVP